jgi:hypothetical protein
MERRFCELDVTWRGWKLGVAKKDAQKRLFG